MGLTVDELEHIAPAAAVYADDLLAQMRRAGILPSPLRAGAFLGQVHVECMAFSRVSESLNYAYESAFIQQCIARGRITEADARRFARTADHKADQSALANCVYGGAWGKKNLGNTQIGDGWRYRGRGLKQLTGRSNYARFSDAMYGDDRALRDPDMVLTPSGAVSSAVWFWVANKLNAVADTGSVEAVTKIVNGGTMGLNERKRWTRVYTAAAAS